MKAGFAPRTKFETAICSELISDSRFQVLHETLEKERSRQFDDLVNKDVERLLSSASRIYGPRKWTAAEKAEFANYCRNLRSGTLTEKDKESLQNFYTKAYQEKETDQEDVKDMLATKSAIFFPEKMKALEREEGFEMPDVKKEMEEEEEGEEERPIFPLGFKCTLDPAQIGNFNPGMKYEKEKEFRCAANNIFRDVISARFISLERAEAHRNGSGLEEDLKILSCKLNQLMKDDKKLWSETELETLKGYLDMFSDKMHFTIVQTKELGMFLRKSFGRLQQYEIERENDTVLQEKRKYWQEYAKTHPPGKKEKVMTPRTRYSKRPNAGTIESLEARRVRKAAYLRQWRIAQKEKQFYTSIIGSALLKQQAESL